ncbi:hypothetical protein K6119_10765 [Paracrocinitomix mangrovi]|uniref:hypothetical protein n=1 Tax=Paracrocinitomix mangrovi TaxID=2862509 RepID=UPI001C8D0A82|nr:hypothetical protein [Paracrocinitomix mangrovi]UKN00214.1 hypothetical protein K6119_10765 [Paracrocinitomix mangrovi]
MQTIFNKDEFENIICQNGEHVFFVHSNWAGQSIFGLKKLELLTERYPDLNITIIDNQNASGFIHDWLKDTQNNYLITKNRPAGSWIHGNGELFEVRDMKITWFRHATTELKEDQLESLLNAR